MNTCTPTTAEQVRDYVDLLFAPDDPVELRRIDGTRPPFSTWHIANELPDQATRLERENRDGWNIYIGVNPRTAKGQRGDANVTCARSVFADFDGGITIDEARQRIADAGLPPWTMAVASGHGIHPYWLLMDATSDMAAWRTLQADLARAVGADPKICNPERIMRLPGFANCKHDDGARCELIELEPSRVYAFADIRAIAPTAKPRPTTPPAAPRTDAAERARRYVAKMPPAISGQGGHDATFAVACELVRFGLSEADAWPILNDYNNRCSPPWNERELRHKLSSARAEVERAGEAGCRLREDRRESTAPRQSPADFGNSEVTAEKSLADYELTDIGNGERLIARYGENLRFATYRHVWLNWTGARWESNGSGTIERLAKSTIRETKKAAAEIEDRNRSKAVYDHAHRSESNAKLLAMIERARAEDGVAVDADELDRDPYLLNVQNATLDLHTGRPREQRREDLLTRICPVDWRENATCPVFLRFLERIFASNHTLIDFVQRMVGYTLTGITGERAAFILFGTGANGKSTFLAAIRALMGDYATQIPAEALLVRNRDAIPNDIARLKGARFAAATELDEGRRLAEAQLKAMTGGEDLLSARFMHGEWFDFRPEYKLYIATNHKPVIRGTDPAIWERIKLIPFAVTIPPEERDRTLADKLRGELSGILRWAVDGCLAWQRDGLGIPDDVKAATAHYRDEMDTLGAFLEAACLIGPQYTADATPLYSAYVSWSAQNGEHPFTQKRFGSQLAERGFLSDRHPSGRKVWRGIGLASECPV